MNDLSKYPLPVPFVGPLRPDEYRCAKCENVYPLATDADWNEEKARAESEADFGLPVSEETHDVLCDDCYKAFMAWFEAPPDAGLQA